MTMQENDLLPFCRYYKGEKENPYDGTKGCLWEYERVWINHYINEDIDYSYRLMTEYLDAGLSDFNNKDGVPITLKALLFNRYEHWNQCGGFEEWYNKYYSK